MIAVMTAVETAVVIAVETALYTAVAAAVSKGVSKAVEMAALKVVWMGVLLPITLIRNVLLQAETGFCHPILAISRSRVGLSMPILQLRSPCQKCMDSRIVQSQPSKLAL